MYNIHVLLNIIYKGFPTVVENIGEALQYIYIYTFLSEIEGEGGGVWNFRRIYFKEHTDIFNNKRTYYKR